MMRKLYECESKFEREKQRDLMLDEILEKICNIEKIIENMSEAIRQNLENENNRIDIDNDTDKGDEECQQMLD
ncbi:MAG: hypothetical protein PUI73_04365 [bacterium]|nr:hypothetical protein [bacterium]MDY5456990.1 hypothetical protein [Bariatricus sp.]